MARHVFFSFHYQRDIFRVNQIRSIPNIIPEAAAGFRDSSLWEESKKKGDSAIHKMIDAALIGTSVTVVCIGAATAGRRFIDYEIRQSIARGNGILGIKIHNLIGHNKLQDTAGAVPQLLANNSFPVYTYTGHVDLAGWIERAAIMAGR
jgi:hypothetical protein